MVTTPTTRTGFSGVCAGHVAQAWKLVFSFPARYSTTRRQARAQRSLPNRAGTGCLGFLLFGFVWFFLPLMFVVAAETVLVAYALVVSAVLGIAATVDVFKRKRTT